MPKFMDCKGREWTVTLDVSAVKAVKKALDVDLLNVVNGELLYKLADDPVLLTDVLYVLCQEQCEEKGVSDVQFGHGMRGGGIDRAVAAFLEELSDFFQSPKRKLLKKALENMKKFTEAAVEKGLEEMEKMDVGKALQEQSSGETSGGLQEP